MLDGGFTYKESEKHEIVIEDLSVDVMKVLMCWMYTGVVSILVSDGRRAKNTGDMNCV